MNKKRRLQLKKQAKLLSMRNMLKNGNYKKSFVRGIMNAKKKDIRLAQRRLQTDVEHCIRYDRGRRRKVGGT